jgi:hypothetical protein
VGHYRSEMGFEDRDAREVDEKARRLAATAAEIQRAIDEKGLAVVLADIILDTNLGTSIGFKYKRWG